MGNSRERAVRQREYDRGKREAEMENENYRALICRIAAGAVRMETDLRSALDLSDEDFAMISEIADAEMADSISRCPACGEPVDYCQGHGEIGDPAGFAILERHDEGDHADCHPAGCEQAGETVV